MRSSISPASRHTASPSTTSPSASTRLALQRARCSTAPRHRPSRHSKQRSSARLGARLLVARTAPQTTCRWTKTIRRRPQDPYGLSKVACEEIGGRSRIDAAWRRCCCAPPGNPAGRTRRAAHRGAGVRRNSPSTISTRATPPSPIPQGDGAPSTGLYRPVCGIGGKPRRRAAVRRLPAPDACNRRQGEGADGHPGAGQRGSGKEIARLGTSPLLALSGCLAPIE